ncbi:hypothetical protein [Pasteuria penetrans]|uniref:hypothetical protein n=1 Tax=Pasteuria penetrans TaxID=86005 RepID=UPI0011EC672B|nr:hypothetical protein [Pasteuria penetrans]
MVQCLDSLFLEIYGIGTNYSDGNNRHLNCVLFHVYGFYCLVGPVGLRIVKSENAWYQRWHNGGRWMASRAANFLFRMAHYGRNRISKLEHFLWAGSEFEVSFSPL